eukprot:Skav218205  [mRNA]  locus=scaffold2232:153259:157270:- [translate_table: standard]
MGHVIAQHGVATSTLRVQSRQPAEGASRLIGDHLALVTEATVQVGHQSPLYRGIPFRHQGLGGVSDQKALGHGALEVISGHGGDHLVQR